MKKLISDILQSEELAAAPPVCIDVGASGKLPVEWQLLAPFSIGVAFDADDRDFRIEDAADSGWKRLIKLNRLVTDRPAEAIDFYLTQSPYCSSALRPDNAALEAWAFEDLFKVTSTSILPAVGLAPILQQLGISHIDWYKSDSQGMDLRIFASLGDNLIDQVIAADFEPGIIDAYVGEDKLFALMAFMDKRPFFLSDMKVWGSQRIGRAARNALSGTQERFLPSILRISPGWAELSYLNDFSVAAPRRKMLLGWVFASIKQQDGHAYSIAADGLAKYGDEIFERCRRASLGQLRKRYPRLAMHVLRRGLSKMLGR